MRRIQSTHIRSCVNTRPLTGLCLVHFVYERALAAVPICVSRLSLVYLLRKPTRVLSLTTRISFASLPPPTSPDSSRPPHIYTGRNHCKYGIKRCVMGTSSASRIRTSSRPSLRSWERTCRPRSLPAPPMPARRWGSSSPSW